MFPVPPEICAFFRVIVIGAEKGAEQSKCSLSGNRASNPTVNL